MKQLIEILLVTFPVIALGADVQPALIGPVLKLVKAAFLPVIEMIRGQGRARGPRAQAF